MDELRSDKPENRASTILLVGAGAALLLIAVIYLFAHYTPAPSTPTLKPLPMGAAEQSYAPQIRFLEPKVARAANFLNQEVTFVFGSVENQGTRPVQQIEITLEFHDLFNQVVLRDKQRLFSPTAPPLAPHENRDFQLTYESVPQQWNQAYPTLTITGLELK